MLDGNDDVITRRALLPLFDWREIPHETSTRISYITCANFDSKFGERGIGRRIARIKPSEFQYRAHT